MSFARSRAVELAPYGILANAIAPGCIHTPMSVIDGVDETQTELFEGLCVGKRTIPLVRPAEPEEIARVVVFLASEECSYVTGQPLVADGGPDHYFLRAGQWVAQRLTSYIVISASLTAISSAGTNLQLSVKGSP